MPSVATVQDLQDLLCKASFFASNNKYHIMASVTTSINVRHPPPPPPTCTHIPQGFLAGVGKGIIGTVAKPVAGLFDFASGTTAALRETTSRVSRQHPPPVRHRRCCVGASGALVPYSMSQARGQEYLMRLNDGEPSEK